MAMARVKQKEKIRVWHAQFDCYFHRVLPGNYFVTGDPEEMIVTVLGSCVSACIRNPFNGFGGLNHFLLPESGNGSWGGVDAAFRYGNFAMEALINEVLKSGCHRTHLEIKLFGGSDRPGSSANIGAKNIEFVKRYLKEEGLKFVASDLGGTAGRLIHYFPATGKVQRQMINDRFAGEVDRQERSYKQDLLSSSVEGDVDLFT